MQSLSGKYARLIGKETHEIDVTPSEIPMYGEVGNFVNFFDFLQECWLFESDPEYKAFLLQLLPQFQSIVKSNPQHKYNSILDWVYERNASHFNKDTEISILQGRREHIKPEVAKDVPTTPKPSVKAVKPLPVPPVKLKPQPRPLLKHSTPPASPNRTPKVDRRSQTPTPRMRYLERS